MAQGVAKLQRKAKSGGATKKKEVRKQALKKGKKQFNPKKKSVLSNGHFQADQMTTKAINQRNESLVAAKALSSGVLASSLFLKDVAAKGKKEQSEQLKTRSKKEKKDANQTSRLKEQLKKLGKESER